MKVTKFILGTAFLLSAWGLQAQNGAIDADKMNKIRGMYQEDGQTKAIRNALTSNSIKDLALNRDNINATDHEFKYKVKVKGITNQKSSGRCWMFTSLNVLRPKVVERLNMSSFEFSESYLYFYDIFEKSNLFLENIIESADQEMNSRLVYHYFRSPVGDGGVWNSFVNLIKKYGVVPKSVMKESYTSSNTREMLRRINEKLREDGLELRDLKANKTSKKKVEARKLEMLSEIYRMLALNLGEPPVEFKWRFKNKDGELSAYKTYTPQSFAKEVIPEVNFDNYVMLMNDPSRPYYKMYEITNDRNVMEGINWTYLNLPNEEIKNFALESIKNNEAMYASCDVGKQMNRKEGFSDVNNYDYESIYGVKFGMDKKQRILTGQSGSSHGMALVAVDVDENEKPTMWQFENSWGSTSGHNGYLTFTDKWFDEYMFRVVVLKKFMDEKTQKLLKQKPVILPVWDPMF